MWYCVCVCACVRVCVISQFFSNILQCRTTSYDLSGLILTPGEILPHFDVRPASVRRKLTILEHRPLVPLGGGGWGCPAGIVGGVVFSESNIGLLAGSGVLVSCWFCWQILAELAL